MTEALEPSALERWRNNPAEFIRQAMINPETGKPFELGRGRLRRSTKKGRRPPQHSVENNFVSRRNCFWKRSTSEAHRRHANGQAGAPGARRDL
jgi:hypothetical protein